MSALTLMSVMLASSASAKEKQPILTGTRSALTQSNSLFGPTGLMTVPTAYTADPGQVAFGASFGDGVRVPSINYGLMRYVEVGGGFVDRDNGRNRFIGNAKVTIIPQNFGNFEVGIGVIDALDAINQTAYFVGSVDLTPPNWDPTGRVGSPIALKVHGGVGTGIFQERIFGGAELLFPNQYSLLGEYDSENFNFGVRYVHDDRFRAQFGVQNKSIFFNTTSILQF